jgi:hypothetical protein
VRMMNEKSSQAGNALLTTIAFAGEQ